MHDAQSLANAVLITRVTEKSKLRWGSHAIAERKDSISFCSPWSVKTCFVIVTELKCSVKLSFLSDIYLCFSPLLVNQNTEFFFSLNTPNDSCDL